MSLDAASRLAIAFSGEARDIDLLAGAARFDVRPNARRASSPRCSTCRRCGRAKCCACPRRAIRAARRRRVTRARQTPRGSPTALPRPLPSYRG
ncbi:hypothetical protein [Sphingomonas sp. 2R-10]|uniref:hypothetical protein n=1 Tax=Sphingomonas sp. 2R-10 TaxID=3045148 RepID=UPI003FA74627